VIRILHWVQSIQQARLLASNRRSVLPCGTRRGAAVPSTTSLIAISSTAGGTQASACCTAANASAYASACCASANASAYASACCASANASGCCASANASVCCAAANASACCASANSSTDVVEALVGSKSAACRAASAVAVFIVIDVVLSQ